MKNKVTIKITGYASSMECDITGVPKNEESKAIQLKITLDRVLHFRTARKVGDIETINHTMLGRLKDSCIPFETLS